MLISDYEGAKPPPKFLFLLSSGKSSYYGATDYLTIEMSLVDVSVIPSGVISLFDDDFSLALGFSHFRKSLFSFFL